MELAYIVGLALASAALPVSWLIFKVHQTWVKANMPAFWAWLYQNRRRDRTIKETRKRVDLVEEFCEEVERWSESADVRFNKLEARTQVLEHQIALLRQKLRSRGIMTDA